MIPKNRFHKTYDSIDAEVLPLFHPMSQPGQPHAIGTGPETGSPLRHHRQPCVACIRKSEFVGARLDI